MFYENYFSNGFITFYEKIIDAPCKFNILDIRVNYKKALFYHEFSQFLLTLDKTSSILYQFNEDDF